MWTSLILALLGYLLIYLEFFLPGAVMGTAGGLLLFVSLFVFILQKPITIFLVLFAVALLAVTYLVIKLALMHVKSTRKNNTVYLDSDQMGFVASSFSKELIGKTGVSSTDLNPSGYIHISEKFIQAVSKSGYIDKNKKIKVIAGEGARLIVKELQE
jgi:membrane-bound ClpP family serine protease